MPTIVVDASKGLHQKASSSTLPAGTLSGQRKVVKTVSASETLTVADSGKLIVIGAHSVTITLPSSSNIAGVHYDFIVGASLSSGASIIATAVTDGSEQFLGGYIGGDNTSAVEVAGSNEDKFTFGTSSAIGDRISVVCNGTDWLVTSGYAQAIANAAFSA